MLQKIKVLYRGLLMAVFALWFGGFTFYTAWVVPTGNRVLGSSRSQGFITQQVTQQLNLIGAIALAFFLFELAVEFRQRTRRKNVSLACIVGMIALLWGCLLLVHPLLDQMIDVSAGTISGEARFYQLHRVYLWTSTIQWVFCWIWLFMTVADWSGQGQTAGK